MMRVTVSRIRQRLLACALSMVSIGWVGCGPPEVRGRYNVILISVDTLRADRLGIYGYNRDTSPNLDRWAADSVVFENAVAESSWTLPSHVTMLSGMLPSNHSTVLPTLRPGESTKLLPEIFAEAGYKTIGLTDGGYMVRNHGFDRGFEVFHSRKKTFDETLNRAEKELSALSEHERFFLFLHTYDVHCPYDPAESYRQMFVSAESEFIETAGRCGNPHFNESTLTPGQVQYLSDSYDAGIRELDDHFGRFMHFLQTAGLLKNTVVIFTSDHGEEFGEHGQIGHERTLYRESLLVPLIVRAPGLTPGRSRSLTGLADIAPTALQLAEIDTIDTTFSFDGRSLDVLSTDPPHPSSQARISELSWQGNLRSVMTPDWHLILDLDDDRTSLFSIADDPRESHDLATHEPEAVEQLKKQLKLYQSSLKPAAAEPIGEQDAEQLERLRSLGYIN